MLELLTWLVIKLDDGGVQLQIQRGNPNQGESSHRAATVDQGSGKLVKYTHSPLPKPTKPMFLQRQEVGAQDDIDTLFVEYQNKSEEFRNVVNFQCYV